MGLRGFLALWLAFVALVVPGAVPGDPALADHMTGRYTGRGVAQGVFLELRQKGTMLQGELSGEERGTLQGRTDGDQDAFGIIDSPDHGRTQFQSRWTPQGLYLRLIDTNGEPIEAFFALQQPPFGRDRSLPDVDPGNRKRAG